VTDSNETYGYDGTVIRGLAYGVVGMCAGDTRVVYLPPRLAFGPAPIDDSTCVQFYFIFIFYNVMLDW
jgi:FKBP-type peptidyl-prolyl cis-trans isomerase 2